MLHMLSVCKFIISRLIYFNNHVWRVERNLILFIASLQVLAELRKSRKVRGLKYLKNFLCAFDEGAISLCLDVFLYFKQAPSFPQVTIHNLRDFPNITIKKQTTQQC